MLVADVNTFYDYLKYWGPIITFFVLVVRAYLTAKKNIGTWADKLLTNHLSHIEASTTNTVSETQKTNKLLENQALKADAVAAALKEHSDKEMQVWETVSKTLVVLEDRTRRPIRKRT